MSVVSSHRLIGVRTEKELMNSIPIVHGHPSIARPHCGLDQLVHSFEPYSSQRRQWA